MLLILSLLSLPFIEVYFYFKSIELIGGWYSFLLSFLNICLGFFLFKLAGFQVVRRVQSDLKNSKLPTRQILKTLIQLVAAVLLIIPGFFTDLLALFILVPGLSHLVVFVIAKKIDQAIKRGAIKVFHKFEQSELYKKTQNSSEIIEVDFQEIVEKP